MAIKQVGLRNELPAGLGQRYFSSWAKDMKAQRPASAGFTLIELLVVIAVIAILAALLLPVLSRA